MVVFLLSLCNNYPAETMLKKKDIFGLMVTVLPGIGDSKAEQIYRWRQECVVRVIHIMRD